MSLFSLIQLTQQQTTQRVVEKLHEHYRSWNIGVVVEELLFWGWIYFNKNHPIRSSVLFFLALRIIQFHCLSHNDSNFNLAIVKKDRIMMCVEQISNSLFRSVGLDENYPQQIGNIIAGYCIVTFDLSCIIGSQQGKAKLVEDVFFCHLKSINY